MSISLADLDLVALAHHGRVGSVVPNLGTEGAALDLTVEGDIVAVDGPSVWVAPDGSLQTDTINDAIVTSDFEIVAPFTWDGETTGSVYIADRFGANVANRNWALVRQSQWLALWTADAGGTFFGAALQGPGQQIPDFMQAGETVWVRARFTTATGFIGIETAGRSVGDAAPPAHDSGEWTLRGTRDGGRAFDLTQSSGDAPVIIGQSVRGDYPYVHVRRGHGAQDEFAYRHVAADFNVSPDAATVTVDSGHVLNVTRSGASPLIVPAGQSLLINPDHTDTANKVTTADNPAFDIGVDQDAILGGTFVVGNQTGSFPTVLYVGDLAGAYLRLYRRNNSDTMNVQASDGTNAVAGAAGAIVFDPTKLYAFFVWLDREGGVLRHYAVDSDGVVLVGPTAAASAVGAISVTEGLTALLGLPGATGALVFDKGGDYSQATIEDIARRLRAPALVGPFTLERVA